MHTIAAEPRLRPGPDPGYRASTDPVDPVRDYNIPIPPYKQPPSAQDFDRMRKRQRRPSQGEDRPPKPPQDDGHVDEYA